VIYNKKEKNMLGPTNTIGLPNKTKKVYKTEIINGIKVKSVNVSWHGTNVGWNVWIQNKKYFKNCLTRSEAIQKCMESIIFFC
jgi:hypothetical protein